MTERAIKDSRALKPIILLLAKASMRLNFLDFSSVLYQLNYLVFDESVLSTWLAKGKLALFFQVIIV